MNQHEVDLIIPVHSATRPVRRAAKSVLDHTKLSVRVTVIAHNIDQKVIEKNLGDLTQDARLRILHLSDFIASPSGPMNLGLSKASAPYVSLLGSDDMLSPGALDSWHRIAVETGATTVIPRIEGGVSGVLPLPPTRRARAPLPVHACRPDLQAPLPGSAIRPLPEFGRGSGVHCGTVVSGTTHRLRSERAELYGSGG